ncbi:MAG: hypothetical protein LBQ91_02840 [Oscillospiraceae bacterium]|jgi:hypothetical protein|nr:hypothetical protein [Oscillospiraceae bacterium]
MRSFIRLSNSIAVLLFLAAAIAPIRTAEYSALDDAPPVRTESAQGQAAGSGNARVSVIYLDDDVIYRTRTRSSCLSDNVYLKVYRRVLESRL